MKLHRFYIPQNIETEPRTPVLGEVTLVHFPELVHQVKNVLKLRTSERLIFFNGDGYEYLSSVVSFEGKESMKLNIEEISKNDVSLPKEVFLFFSIIKKDNVEWILEKGTEIGVSHFIPIVSSRSEKKDINMDRAGKIVTEASEQCGRNTIPTIHKVMKLEDVFNEFDLSFIVLEKDAVSFTEKNIKDSSIGLFIGPEGGWTKEEIEMFKNKNVDFRSLGTTTLRAETAAVVGSSLILNN
jgi:16S rRNA (uracil1498-N3)-methyltransferase